MSEPVQQPRSGTASGRVESAAAGPTAVARSTTDQLRACRRRGRPVEADWRSAEPRVLVLLLFLVLGVAFANGRAARAAAISVSVHAVLLADPHREASLARRQLQALRRVTREIATKGSLQ